MSHDITTIILNFISTLRINHQEVALIDELNGFFGCDQNIFLFESSPSTYYHRYVHPLSNDKVDNRTMYVPQTILYFDSDINRQTMLEEITGKNPFLIVVVEGSNYNFAEESKLLHEIVRIRDLKINLKVGVFFTHSIRSMNNIRSFFRWCWQVKIFNIFSAFDFDDAGDPNVKSPLNIFNYNPFGTFDLINVTGSTSPRKYFPDNVPNFRRHPLRLIILKEANTSLHEITFWRTVIGKFNATFTITERSVKDLSEAEEDVLPYIVSASEDDFFLYPHRISHLVLMVPHAKPQTSFTTLLKNLMTTRIFGCAILMIVVISLVLIISGHLQRNEISVFKSVADVLNILMNDNANINYRQLRSAEVWIMVPLTFVGLVAVNGIFSTVLSYITLPTYQNQIKTIDDLYKSSSVPLFVDEHVSDMVIEILTNLSGHGGWEDRVRAKKLQEIKQQIRSLNNNMACTNQQHDSKVMLEVQKRLDVEAFHVLAEPYLEKSLHTFSTQKLFVFNDYLNDMVHHLQSGGLIDKWYDEFHRQSVAFMLKFYVHFQKRIVDDSDLSTIPTIVWCGWIASLMAFICEIIWNKYGPRIQWLKLISMKRK